MRVRLGISWLCAAWVSSAALAIAQPAPSAAPAASTPSVAPAMAPTTPAAAAAPPIAPAAAAPPIAPAAAAPAAAATPASLPPAGVAATIPEVPSTRSIEELRGICAEALNRDKQFAADALRVLDERKVVELEKAQQKFANIQIEAGARIAKNQRHVILAYAAMWLAAVGFLLYLWRRQGALRHEIVTLRSELADAVKGGK